ncbi:MAG: hypothetical protein ACAI35_15365, partial [Candidatus Methylacidiphilales bacterium]
MSTLSSTPPVSEHGPEQSESAPERNPGQQHADLPPLPSAWYRHGPVYRFTLIGAALFTLMSYPHWPSLTVPVTATIFKASLRDLSPFTVIWSYQYEYEIGGQKHKSSSYIHLGRYRPDTLDWLPQPGDQLRVYTNAEHSDEASIVRQYSRWPDIISRIPLLFYFWSMALLVMFWSLYVALVRPAAAGLRHRVEPGQRVCVQLRWRGNALRPEVFLANFNAFGLFFICCMFLTGPLIAQGMLMLAVGAFYAGRLADRAKCSTEIVADLEAGTLQVPCFDETAHSEDYNTPTPIRTLPLADAESFFVRSF